MLKIVNSMNQLDFSKLMYVYSEGNTQNGAELYPHLTIESQIREAELDFYRYLNDIFFRIADAFYAVLESNNHYLAALRMEPYRDGWILCALETTPSERNRGHAAELINSVKNHLPQGEEEITIACDLVVMAVGSKKNVLDVEGVTVPVYYAGDCSGERTASIAEAIRGGYKAANEI